MLTHLSEIFADGLAAFSAHRRLLHSSAFPMFPTIGSYKRYSLSSKSPVA